MQQIILLFVERLLGCGSWLPTESQHNTVRWARLLSSDKLWLKYLTYIPSLGRDMDRGESSLEKTAFIQKYWGKSFDMTWIWHQHGQNIKSLENVCYLCFVFREVLFFSAPYTDTKVDVNKRCWPSMLTHFSYIF